MAHLENVESAGSKRGVGLAYSEKGLADFLFFSFFFGKGSK